MISLMEYISFIFKRLFCWTKNSLLLVFSFSSLIMSSHCFSVSTGYREKSTKFLAFTIIKRKLVFEDTMLLEEGMEIKNIKMVKKSLFLNWDSVILEKKNVPQNISLWLVNFQITWKCWFCQDFPASFIREKNFTGSYSTILDDII